ncbi:hypothetical protein [Romboutsia sp.]|uniref:hypothetical protein n=1 Tax=Romboutsia sp. TaxID=1965302 RepID=UPI002CE251A5|nr:hypothetical protein [Romboutsia sp.]HSQ87201.1 hypothetical protein [Romboutsia sp.]
MGSGVSFICKECGKEENYLTGIGMSDSSLEAFFNGENKRDYNRIKKIIDNLENSKEMYTIDYSREVYLCDNCGFIGNKKAVSIITKYWRYDYIYNCPKCKDTLRRIDIDNEVKLGNIKCQKCKSANLYVPEFEILCD